jgi:hypothetical protein
VEKSILDVLEERIHYALGIIAEMQKKNLLLVAENSDLKERLAEQSGQIEDLHRQLTEQNSRSEQAMLEKYRETEERLRERVKAMLAKLDELKALEDR